MTIQTLIMEDDPITFPQQQAPEKDTDRAFVQVGKDGEPVIPDAASNAKQEVRPATGNTNERT